MEAINTNNATMENTLGVFGVRKALELQKTEGQLLVQSLEQAKQVQYNNPPHLGNAIDTRA